MATKKTARKKHALRNHPIIASMNFRNPAMLAAITIVALTGVYLVVRLLAAQVTAFEAEGERTGSVALLTDSNASDNQYIQFGGISGGNPPPPPPVQPPPPPPVTPPPPPPVQPPPPPPPPAGGGQKCLISLHGKSGYGGATSTNGDTKYVRPNGNAEGWGALQWLYFPESGYQEVKNIVSGAISSEGCGQVIVYGFSNGAAAAAKLFCRGETFGGKAIGYIVDDPVVDHALDAGCAHTMNIAMYWTGAIDRGAGWNCASEDWTCEGGSTISVNAYQGFLGTTRKQSIFGGHQSYFDGGTPPELNSWW